MSHTFFSMCIILFILICINQFNSTRKKNIEYRNFLSKDHLLILKGIASILIVVSHIANEKNFAILNPLGGIGVALFLISSGYGLNESYKNKGLINFFKKKFQRVYIPYILISLLAIVINIKPFANYNILQVIFLIDVSSYMWYIQYIIIWYVIFYIVKKFVNKKLHNCIFLMFGLLFLIIFKDTVWGEQSLSFVLGVLLSEYPKINSWFATKSMKSILLMFVQCFIFSIIFLALKIYGFDNINNYFIMSVIQLLMKLSSAIFLLKLINVFQNSPFVALKILGIYSYEIYLTHVIAIGMIDNNNSYSLIIIFFALIIGLSVVLKKTSSIFI